MHPYRSFPSRQFWSRAVAGTYDPSDLATVPRPLIRRGDRIVSAGSCFGANLVPYLESHGFCYLRTESRHPGFVKAPPEAMSYAAYSAAYGNVYTARQLYQLLLRALGRFEPREDRWQTADAIVDPFRPGMRYAARSEREFELLTAQHLRATRRAFESCDVFVATLGLTEAWVSTLDGAVFPACPGTVAGTFDPTRHEFVNFTAADVAGDLDAFVTALRAINPEVRVILTVSPVPLVATATSRHVLAADTYSKASLRVAAEAATRAHRDVHYFPSYEIVVGPRAPAEFFEADRRTVSKHAVDVVMAAFLSLCETDDNRAADEHPRSASNDVTAQELSRRIVDGECEEAALDPQRMVTNHKV
jgi:hypothetical protein